MDNIKATVDTTIKAEIIKALNGVPEAIEKLVQAALERPVYDSTGRPDRAQYDYNSKQLPFLDWLVGQEIRHATEQAVRNAIAELKPTIRAEVEKKLNAESVVDAFTNAIVGTVGQSWKLKVTFEREKD